MKTRQALLGFAGLGLVLALPAHAAGFHPIGARTDVVYKLPALEFSEGSFMVAKREDGDSRAETRGDQRDESRGKANKRPQARDTERAPEHQEYGYGYERRQQHHPTMTIIVVAANPSDIDLQEIKNEDTHIAIIGFERQPVVRDWLCPSGSSQQQ